MPITNIQIKKAKPRNKKYTLSAGKSLFLLVMPSGGKSWKYRYRIDGKAAEYSLGSYPDISLSEANESVIALRKLVKQGIHPLKKDRKEKQVKRLQNEYSFRTVAESWIKSKENQWTPNHKIDVERSLQNHIFPHIADLPVHEITAADLLQVLRKLEDAGSLEMLSKVTQRVRLVFALAVIEGKIPANPASDLKSALKTPVSKNYRHVSIAEFPRLLRDIDDYDHISGVYPVTRLAMQLLALVFTRTKELRTLEWVDIDFEKQLIEIPADRMKMNQPHLVPLSTQSISIIEELKIYTSGSRYLFCQQNNKHKPMSENAVLYALYSMGYHGKMTGHGFRHTASTQLNEMGFRPDLIEKQLAHGDSNKIRAVYNKALYLPERAEMLQSWADYIDVIKQGDDVVPLKKKNY